MFPDDTFPAEVQERYSFPDDVFTDEVLLDMGVRCCDGSGSSTPSNRRVRLVQRKELFSACEYKTIQDVYDCTLEYSDDNADWTVAATFNIVGGRVSHTFNNPSLAPRRYWRVDLKGYALPANPTAPLTDRGFFTFGRLWEALFFVERRVETTTDVAGTTYTFTADVPGNWLANQRESLAVDVSLSPAASGSQIFYRPGSDAWTPWTGTIPAADIQTDVCHFFLRKIRVSSFVIER